MRKKQQILIITESAEKDLETVKVLRREPDWNISPVSSAEEAIASFYAKPFDVIIVGKGVNSTDEQKLRAVLNHCSFESIVLKQTSDNVEELKNYINENIIAKRADALKHIHVNDTLNVNNLADDIRIMPVS